MPYLDIRIANADLADSARRTLATHGTALLQRILGKHAELTVVSLAVFPAASWMIGGRARPGGERPAAHVEATITTGTNTAEEKAEFIAAMAALLKQTLPGLHPVLYVVVREIDAASWGFDGVTQQARKQQTPRPARAPGLSPSEPEIRRSQSGAVDTEFYMARARKLRDAAMRDGLRRLVAAIRRLPAALRGRNRDAPPLRPYWPR